MEDLSCCEKFSRCRFRLRRSTSGKFNMNLDSDWNSNRSDRGFRAVKAGMGLLRVTLLFGSAAIALALVATPYLADHSRQQAVSARYGGLDLMSTGSIGASSYTVRRSVLQSSPNAICVISDNGMRSGDC
jgi:hypothetical protein